MLILFFGSNFLFYPLLVVAAVFYCWWIALSVFAFRLIIQGIVYSRSMQQLNEKDLIWLYPLLDVWQWFYYLFFATTLFKKPRANWK